MLDRLLEVAGTMVVYIYAHIALYMRSKLTVCSWYSKHRKFSQVRYMYTYMVYYQLHVPVLCGHGFDCYI